MSDLPIRPGIFLAILLLTGCHIPSQSSDLVDADPARKIPAIKAAVTRGDQANVRHLVDDLESDDPAVRLYAIHGLKDLTGRTFGYHYYEEEEQRAAAAARWRAWLAGSDKP